MILQVSAELKKKISESHSGAREGQIGRPLVPLGTKGLVSLWHPLERQLSFAKLLIINDLRFRDVGLVSANWNFSKLAFLAAINKYIY